ncbi:MAG: hypothetical protein LBC84_08465, partial [Prevotellaceae bacterium]|nr:hypothetical protein [Prevotellaceae bacterium]
MAAMLLPVMLIASCEKAGNGTEPEGGGKSDEEITRNLPKLEVSITGTISHTTYTTGQSGTVSFNR